MKKILACYFGWQKLLNSPLFDFVASFSDKKKDIEHGSFGFAQDRLNG